MAFPPEFSSTETYANRYDLDEINVFLEGDSSNPMFFNYSGLPPHLSFGKHYFHLSILNDKNLNYRLKPNSQILFEFKSINNVVLRSDITDVQQKNGTALCFVEVLQDPLRTTKEIEDGIGTLTIVGSLENKKSSRNFQNVIPEQFLDAMNYRCIFPISIAKNIIDGTSPFPLSEKHKTSTLQGQFSFAKANISPLKSSTKGLIYNPTTGNPAQAYYEPAAQDQESTN
jgi:hypothetical protein